MISSICQGQGYAAESATKDGLFPDELVSTEVLLEKINSKEPFLLFDARSKRSFDESHIMSARLPLTEEYYRQEDLFKDGIIKSPPDRAEALKTAVASIPRDTPIVTYCNTGCHASSVLVLQLKQLGFTQAKAYEDGFQAWQQKGHPVYMPPKKVSQ
jgi:rhodanese-related sulfurtransferase